MYYTSFEIKNFKGIENIKFDLNTSPKSNIYTLVGLNESGKTSILEAIYSFKDNKEESGLDFLKDNKFSSQNFTDNIPISEMDNFNNEIQISVGLTLEPEDEEKVKQFVKKNLDREIISDIKNITITQTQNFKASTYQNTDYKWGLDIMVKSKTSKKPIPLDPNQNKKGFAEIEEFVKTLIPSILYFPDFLFNFPKRLYLEIPPQFEQKKFNYYKQLIQDILDSLENKTNIQEHLIDRAKSDDESQKRAFDSLILKMGRQITKEVFTTWNKIFHNPSDNRKITIKEGFDNIDGEKYLYLELFLEESDSLYYINQRSLGFRWFFVFLLFTQFRALRKNAPKNILLLLDEPASNLHSTAQSHLLNSLEKITKNSTIIYTTHSHHMINPNWLEGTYIVKNEGIDYDMGVNDYSTQKTNIKIQKYRNFVTKNPSQTNYFKPILDVLDYVPSKLENVQNAVILEGKNDFYTLSYLKNIILEIKNEFNFIPGTSSSNLGTLISLYIGWGKEFIILLDSDEEGIKQKERYKTDFGQIVETRIFTLEDINSLWKNYTMENLFSSSDQINFQKRFFKESTEYVKENFNRSIQEALIKKTKYTFSKPTLENFKQIIRFIEEKLP